MVAPGVLEVTWQKNPQASRDAYCHLDCLVSAASVIANDVLCWQSMATCLFTFETR